MLRALSAISLALTLSGAALAGNPEPTANLNAPTHDPLFSGNFVSIQLRRIGGTSYEVNVFDRSFDSSSLAAITVTDLDTGAVIFDKAYSPSIGNFSNPGTFAEPLAIEAKNFSVRLRSQEFSGSSVFFGNDRTSVGSSPPGQLNDVTRCYFDGEPMWALDADTHNPFFSGNFVSIQLRRIAGTTYEVNVFDRTPDPNSLAAITVTDLDTGAVIFDRTYPTSIGHSAPGTFAENITIAAPRFSVRLRSREFTGSSVFFGNDRIFAGGGPISQLNDVTRCYYDVPGCPTGEDADALTADTHNPLFSGNFVSIQLRRLGAVNYEVNVFDRTGDPTALAAVTVTDLRDGSTIFDKTYPGTIGNLSTPGTFAENIVIDSPLFSVRLRTREFSGSSVFFGGDRISVGSNPTNQLNDVTRCYFQDCTGGTGPGSVVDLGGACGNGGTLGVTGPVTIGNGDFAVTLTGADASAPLTFCMYRGSAGANFPPCGGCNTIQPDQAITIALSGGEARHNLPIPCDLTLQGLEFDFQWLTFGATSTPCPSFPGVAVSNAARLTLQ